MRRIACIALVLALSVVGASSAGGAAPKSEAGPPHTITLVNDTAETIWPAAWPGSTSGRTGWTLRPGASLSFKVPQGWNARLWGRTGCHFGGGEGGCRTGDCEGRYQCKGWGAIPATLAEYDMNSYKGLDFYDVSMVDGSNLPMYINVTHGEADKRVDEEGCLAPGKCTTEVKCPAALRVPRGSRDPVGCISPCARFGTDRYCCGGPFATGCDPATTWPIDYAKVFKRAEPYAYSWSGDDATSVFTCHGDCDYRIVFGVTPPAVGGPPGWSRPAPAPPPPALGGCAPMDVTIRNGPAFAVARCTLGAGEAMKAGAGAMMAHSVGVELESKVQGGLMKGLKRSLLGGESFFQTTWTAPDGGGWVDCTANLPGDLAVLEVDGAMNVTQGGWLCSSTEIELDTKWGGFKNIGGGEGGFLVHASGTGKIVVACYGAMETIELGPGEQVVLDSGHLVAFDPSVDYITRKVTKGIAQTLKSGEGFVMEFTGPGRILSQTRNVPELIDWLTAELPFSRES